jgi:hypothetical protein
MGKTLPLKFRKLFDALRNAQLRAGPNYCQTTRSP